MLALASTMVVTICIKRQRQGGLTNVVAMTKPQAQLKMYDIAGLALETHDDRVDVCRFEAFSSIDTVDMEHALELALRAEHLYSAWELVRHEEDDSIGTINNWAVVGAQGVLRRCPPDHHIFMLDYARLAGALEGQPRRSEFSGSANGTLVVRLEAMIRQTSRA
ncbi:MAG: hypothetical protein Q7S80_01400, partial [bacterium]|nr:hypothetical protein [bacterium]